MTEVSEIPLHMRRAQFDPISELGEVRDSAGVCPVVTPFGVPAHLVSRYDDVREVLSDSARFSTADRRALTPPDAAGPTEEEYARARVGNLLSYDPPEHTRLRRMLTPEFTMRRMRALEPRIVDIVNAALDDVERAGKPADLVSTFALPVPSLVICELLGVPYADRADFQRRTADQLDASQPPQRRLALQQASRAYMATLVERARRDPGEDILGMLVREHGDDVSAEELVGIASLLLLAGHETTANMLGLGTLALLRHPDQLARVRDDPASVEPAVEELLRWLSIVHAGIPRTATTEVTIAGSTIAAGEHVVLALPGANRDPALVDDPDHLDITREPTGHVAFGHGLHHCLGAPLARLELRIAYPSLLRRFPGLALAVPYEQIAFRPYSVIHGLQALPVTW
ncbi:cytochrome P450 [Frankia torreyi]|uniref:Cytochrome P450 n=1 Tax=Frankia torreyi TaxID=1856 RepID=A0A0D8BAK5_9ACTN|nr:MULTISPECIES: cytochrome P450 [Frankia]KJE20407.1 cytochrome P450 [Frankia torreyi]KQM02813.1 cytochrome P450 [Frankia sp. CpI1-P]